MLDPGIVSSNEASIPESVLLIGILVSGHSELAMSCSGSFPRGAAKKL